MNRPKTAHPNGFAAASGRADTEADITEQDATYRDALDRHASKPLVIHEMQLNLQ